MKDVCVALLTEVDDFIWHLGGVDTGPYIYTTSIQATAIQGTLYHRVPTV
jgi:hypothetical protein